jgi:hypothetical protein
MVSSSDAIAGVSRKGGIPTRTNAGSRAGRHDETTPLVSAGDSRGSAANSTSDGIGTSDTARGQTAALASNQWTMDVLFSHYIYPLVVVPACTYLLYRNSLDAGFVWDDRAAIVSAICIYIYIYAFRYCAICLSYICIYFCTHALCIDSGRWTMRMYRGSPRGWRCLTTTSGDRT